MHESYSEYCARCERDAARGELLDHERGQCRPDCRPCRDAHIDGRCGGIDADCEHCYAQIDVAAGA